MRRLIVLYLCVFAFLRYFSLPTGTRGTGCDIAEIEEAAHCHPDLFSKIIAALLSMEHVPCLAISTPDDENNYYSKLPEILHPVSKKPLFKVIKIGMACDACIEKQIKCVHKKHHIPAWKSGVRQLIAETLVESSDTTKKQEMLGVIAGSSVYCFVQSWVSAFARRPRWFFKHPVQVLHVGIDPSGGGSGSEFSILSLAHEGPYTVVSPAHASSLHSVRYQRRRSETKYGTVFCC